MDLAPLIDTYRGPLIALLHSFGASPRDAVELAQDAFAEAYLSRERFAGDWEDTEAVGAWIRGIAHNLFRTNQRKSTGSGRLVAISAASQEAAEPQPDALEQGEQRTQLLEALDQLKGSWRTVLMMRYVEGSSLAVIGGLLGMSERAVEGRLRRARAALKEQLQQTGSMENPS